MPDLEALLAKESASDPVGDKSRLLRRRCLVSSIGVDSLTEDLLALVLDFDLLLRTREVISISDPVGLPSLAEDFDLVLR